MRTLPRLIITAAAVPVCLTLAAAPVLAHQCMNANKQQDSGWRVLVDTASGGLTFNDRGLERQFATDPDAAMERFSGLVGLDFDSDGVADFTTYVVTPEDELPHEAQERGAACNGILHWSDYFACMAT